MSTDFRITNKRVPVSDLLDGRLEAFGVREHPGPDVGKGSVRLAPESALDCEQQKATALSNV